MSSLQYLKSAEAKAEGPVKSLVLYYKVLALEAVGELTESEKVLEKTFKLLPPPWLLAQEVFRERLDLAYMNQRWARYLYLLKKIPGELNKLLLRGSYYVRAAEIAIKNEDFLTGYTFLEQLASQYPLTKASRDSLLRYLLEHFNGKPLLAV